MSDGAAGKSRLPARQAALPRRIQGRGGVRDPAQFRLLKNCDIFFLESYVHVTFFSLPFLHPGTAMAKPSKKSRRKKGSPRRPSNSPPASRRASAERRMRILERLTCGLTVAHIAR